MAEVIVATIMRPEGETGVQTHFRAFLRWLAGQGHAASLATPYDSPLWLVYPVFGLRVILHRLHGGLSVWWYRHWHAVFLEWALRRRLRDGRVCVVYAQCPLSAAAALRARASAAQKVVMVVHFNVSQADEWAQKGLIAMEGRQACAMRAFEARTLAAVDGLVFVSAFMQRTLAERLPGIAGVPAAVIPNFVADPGTPPESRTVEADLVTIGTLEPRKNQRYALDIVAAAAQRGHRLHLTVVGDGPDRAALEAHAAELGIAGQVRFLGFRKDAATLIAAHRACLHVARMESFGLVLIEAQSRGVPTFAGAVGGIPEVMVDDQTGAFLPLDAADDAAAVLMEWLGNPARLAESGRQARARFLECFESQAVAQRLHAFLLAPRPL
ncbi:MAG: glycosyltransferase family 4 protein [Burkholderiaceae bacterium]|nr:glycosyltransferase family 4 protein [Burkholderiaceae bacterium]